MEKTRCIMAKAQRVDKLLRELASLEESYETALTAALQAATIRGASGLFGQNDSVFEARGWKPVKSDDARDLLERGAIIAELRTELVLEPYRWHARYLELRGRGNKNLPSEPRLATMLLEELRAAKTTA